MILRKVALVTVMVGSLGLVGLVLPAVAMNPPEASSSATASVASSECIQTYESGTQRWIGEASPELEDLGNSLQRLVDDNPSEATGVAYCTNFDGVVIFVSSPGEALLDAITAAGDEHSEFRLFTEYVAGSQSDLVVLSARVIAELEGLATSVGPHKYTGGLHIGIDQAAWPLSDGDRDRVERVVEALHGSTLPLAFSVMGEMVDSTRAADSPPYWMGAELRSTSHVCSAGVPLIVNGGHRLLTAGHCLGSTFSNNGSVVGTQYTTAYPGNAALYGDWKLIQGSSYGLRVFNADLASNSSLPITGAAWGGRPNGSGICSSGRTTGQICRYYVSGDYDYVTYSGVTAGQQLRLVHDSTGTGLYPDSNGWQDGDSGGPCYYADGSGGVNVSAIVKGRSIYAEYTTYYCTQLSGVRAWSSTATLG